MRINHNISSMITQGALFQVNAQNNRTLEKLSTGLRINRASDDAAGLSISENLRTQVVGLNVAKRNAQDGVALLQIAEGGLNEISSILQRMRELAVQSSNDTLTSTERAYTNQEYLALTSEIDRIVNTTMYNGQSLLTGDGFGGVGQTSSILHIGPNDGVADQITITIDTMTTAGTVLDINGSGLSSQAAAVSAITSLDAAINEVNSTRSDLGAYVNRLEHAINNIINQEHNNQAAESLIRDTDFAVETATFTKNQILMQSATAMLAQANQVPQNVLALLGR
jgi:flagellin